MKTLKIVLAFLFIIHYSFGQNGFTNIKQAKNNTDANGLKQGKWVEYLDDSNQPATQNNAKYYRLTVYKDGKESEIQRSYYYPSGKLAFETPYTDGKRNGIRKYYYESGKLATETPYTDGKRNGIVKIYYESGKIQQEIPYTDHKMNGIGKRYYESGKIIHIIPFKEDNINGVLKEYDENGKLTSQHSYTDGKKNQTEAEVQEAKDRYELAINAYENKEYEKAIEQLRKIYDLV
jgi:antitoxin component YwqK of YwqJK toxin-antitoxin module